MAEWLLVILAIVGIILLGFFFSALDFFKGLTRFLIFGLLVFLLFLLANRILPTIDSGQPYGRNYPSDENFRLPRLDRDSDVSEFFRNLGEDIDEFVFGPSEPSTTTGTSEGSRDLVYPIPGTESDPGTVAEQPPSSSSQPQGPTIQLPDAPPTSSSTGSPSARQSTSQPAYQAPNRRPVSAMW